VDGLRQGTAEEDGGTYVAHLVGLAHVHRRAAPRIDAHRDVIWSAMPQDLDADALGRAALGTLLGLATTPFRRQEPDWPSRTSAWLDRCERWADGVRGLRAS
jgi:hypothetical protein